MSLACVAVSGCGAELTTPDPIQHLLAVLGSGTRSGMVVSEPAGVDCAVTAGAPTGDCSESYDEGTTVTLTAMAAEEAEFDGWTGGGCGGSSSCVVTMDQAHTVTATFTKHHALTVTGAGSGGGAVSSDPSGIGCTLVGGSPIGGCGEPFNEGAEVTLTAVPDDQSVFDGWTGGGCAGSAPCTVTMDQAQDVVATFTLTLGIFTEWGPRLQPDTDSFIGVFEGAGGILSEFVADDSERMEGQESLRATLSTSGDGFAGWFVGWGDMTEIASNAITRDMSPFSGGQLSFWVRSPIELEVGIRSGDVRAGLETSNVRLTETTDFIADDSWHQICLPLSTLVGVGPTPSADLSRLKIFFVVAVNTRTGDTGGQSRTFWIDDVRWVGRPCP